MKPRKPFNPKTASREDGFAIPIAIGIGLIMILLATTAIVRSQDDRVAAMNKSGKAQSINAAELKAAQIQAFLNTYRAAVSLTDTGWAGTTLANLPSANAVCSASSTLSTAITAITSMANTGWAAVDSADPTKGQFKLDSYSGSTGQLVVQGRANTGTPAEATSQITVTIPIFQSDLEQTAGIWVQTSLTGSPTVKSDVLGPCSGTIAAIFPSSGAGSDKAILRTRLAMPSAPSQPTSGNYTLTSLASVSNQTLPRSGDVADTDGVFKYIVPSIDSSFKVTPGNKVYLWVTGNIDLQNKVIVNPCGASGSSPSCSPFDVRIYGTATASPTLTLNQTGTAVCDVFFHLPNYAATLNTGGTANTQDCGGGTKNTGVYWVNTWNSAATGTSLDANRGTWGQAPTKLPPRIGPISQWDS